MTVTFGRIVSGYVMLQNVVGTDRAGGTAA